MLSSQELVVLEIIRDLARGIDPVSKEGFSTDSPLREPNVTQALYTGIDTHERKYLGPWNMRLLNNIKRCLEV